MDHIIPNEEADVCAGLFRILRTIKSDNDAFYEFVLDTARKFRQYDEDPDPEASLERALSHVACMWSGNFDLFPEPEGPEEEAEWERNLEEVVTRFEDLRATRN